MYLTDKRNGKPRNLADHDELEVLLESFSKQVEEIVNESENIAVGLSIEQRAKLSTSNIRDYLGKRIFNTRNC